MRLVLLFTLTLTLGCSKPQPNVSRESLVERPVSGPQEVCKDDTGSSAEHIQVPFAYFDKGMVILNGQQSSKEKLFAWADSFYRDKPEQGLWVQIVSDDGAALRTIKELKEHLPKLRVFDVGSDFKGCK